MSHPNVVTIYDTARWRERAYFVMEWIDGLDGQKWMATPRTWQEVRDVFVQAGQGLAAAHERGIQHRDFKLENMLIGNDGRVAVADFGISDSLRELENTDPRWGAPVGTPAYMAPERLRGERGDARSDQFSFCVAMHRGLYRLRPFAGEEPEELLEAIELGEVRADSRVDVPRWLSGVVRKGLAHDPDHRYRDMHELLTALRWPYFAIALVATAVAALALIWPVRSPAPEPPVSGETEVSPYEVILGLIATDEFAAAEEYWRKHKADLTDAEGLQLARACLARAKQLKPTDRTTANLAGYTGFTIAIHVSMFGKTSETQAEGRRLATEAVAIARADIATEISPYDVVLGLIATDEFLKAKRLWLEHASELSDAQQLKIADACLRRAIHLESADGTKAREAAAVAFQVATRVQHVGSAEEAESASRISSKAMAVGFEPGVRP